MESFLHKRLRRDCDKLRKAAVAYFCEPIIHANHIKDPNECRIGDGTVLTDCSILGTLITGKNCRLNGVCVSPGCTLALGDGCNIFRSLFGSPTGYTSAVSIGDSSTVILTNIENNCAVSRNAFIYASCIHISEALRSVGEDVCIIRSDVEECSTIGRGSVLVASKIAAPGLRIGSVLSIPDDMGSLNALISPKTIENDRQSYAPVTFTVEAGIHTDNPVDAGSEIEDGAAIIGGVRMCGGTPYIHMCKGARLYNAAIALGILPIASLSVGENGYVYIAQTPYRAYQCYNKHRCVVEVASNSTLLIDRQLEDVCYSKCTIKTDYGATCVV